MTGLSELKKRAAAWRRANDALEAALAADDGDMNEQQIARSAELWEEAAGIKTELTAHGFGFLFQEAAETSKHLIT
jgi:anti-sigma factor RsiW